MQGTFMKYASASEINLILHKLQKEGWVVYEMDGKCIQNKFDFFSQVRKLLPLDPPLSGNEKWDALEDSLWGGLYETSASYILIVWRSAFFMERLAAQDFRIAVDILSDLAKSISDKNIANPKQKEVAILLESEHPGCSV